MKSISIRIASACRNRHKRRGRFSCNSGYNRINNEVHEFDTLLPTGFGNRQNTFNKTTAGFTLSTETALSPEHSFSQNPFCGVIGWFETFNRGKCPHSLSMPEDIFTHAFSLFDSAPKTTSQKSFHSGFEGNKLLCESLPGYFSILEAFPKIEHPYFLRQAPLSDGFRCTSLGNHLLEIPYQVCMADSTALYRKTPVCLPPIASCKTLKITSRQFPASAPRLQLIWKMAHS